MTGRSPGRAGNPLAWGPAQRRSPPALEGAARRQRRRQAEAERLRGGRSPSPPAGARVGPGANSRGVWPGAAPLSRSKAPPGGEGVASQRRSNEWEGAATPTGRSPGGVGKPLAWGPAQRRPPPALGGAARRRRHCQAEAERLRGGRGPSPPGGARVGPGSHSGGGRPRFSLRAEGASGCMGVARPRPQRSDQKWQKPGSG